ncbi:MAG: endonuclease/exonuclease/phosphatase family protein [Candidatus Thiodiazotropha taylori]|nr:endonuclease/exonuclease/phosphatase family protein [Candidatus Thiodiazotropha taylori]MCW4250634.1 reverse transcriptase domain-containing protein [Candidatus Thiodiazotropha endolucinida]MCG7884018.1 endonuclease/exonuclease/phosphatase family protein [Candidatus Thiodiazotropha taylori]MCG8033225.1 endonuclease/exonuclease/phosphatase family protein [Candidatus Thiodiazotropha taylori]MCG8044615.1 endonuclease/exonuclease/phosphatase family protein [Candidatus Thiodiazotropha taylori]
MHIGLHYCHHLKIKGLSWFTNFELVVFLSILLLNCGDIETNPGPAIENSTLSDSSLSFPNETAIREKLSLVHYNVQSLANKKDLLLSEFLNFSIISITETWLDQRTSDEDISFNGYVTYRRDRIGDNHGGVCVYVRDDIFSKRRQDLELPNLECVWVEINTHNRKVLIGTFYRPPNSSSATFQAIEDSIGLATDTNASDILITGDFNIDMSDNRSSRKITDLCQEHGLDQIITDYTHFTETSQSTIDLILTNNSNGILISGVGEPFLEQNIRYHCPVFCVLNFDKHKTHTFKRHIWLFNQGQYQSLSDELRNTNWELMKDVDINKYALNLTDYLMKTSSKHIPNKTINVRPSDPSWLSTNIKKLIRKRKRSYNKFKKTKSNTDFEAYKRIRNHVNNAIRDSKQKTNEQLAEKLNNGSLGPKDWWRTLKHVIKPSESSNIPPLNCNGNIFSDNKEKAEAFNDFFSLQNIIDETNAKLPQSDPTNDQTETLHSIQLTPSEIESCLKSLQTGKAAGPDTINNRLLKELSNPLSHPLCDLFNYSLSTGQFPESWKQANVTPIHKKNDPSDPSNYRPISLLSALGKVLEKLVHKHVFNFFRENRRITCLQSGFVPGDSTVNQLIDIYNTFCKALDEGKEVRAIFCDISKAFDRVWHKGLLYKLNRVGITGSLLSWFTNYLSYRSQRVVLPGASSSWKPIRAGVPQGSILGPLLFLVYINDIVNDIHCSIRLFADDTSLYIIVENPIEAAQLLNADLERIHQWANQWLVSFNPAKSEALLLSRKLNKPNHPQVTMNNQAITEVNTHKHLGLIFSNDCTWHDHLDEVRSKAWKRINVMRRLKFLLDRKSLQTIYFSFIRPLLEYADVVWDNCTQYEANELEKIQIEAARIVTGATRLVSLNNLYTETGWETLASRRHKHKIIAFYKMYHGISPAYLSSLLPSTIGENVSYNLRNPNNLRTIQSHSQLYYNSFFPSAVRTWNTLPEETRHCTTTASLKHHLNENINPPPRFYNEGKRLGQILHSRLRTKCSSLNEHLFSKNIVPNASCSCGLIEDTKHFLLHCPLYHNIRNVMLRSVSQFSQPSLNVLLYGDPNLNHHENVQIFLSVHNYILKTKRFEVNR